MESKRPWESKTLIFNFIMAVLALFWPVGHEFMVANPEIFTYVILGANVVLRIISKGAIQISDSI